MWEAAAINAGGKLLGGLLGSDKGFSVADQRKATKRLEKNRYQWLVKGAQKAGFNPLTVLRSTGGNMMQADAPVSPFGVRQALGEAVEAFSSTYADDVFTRATEDRAEERWKDRFDYANPTRGQAASGAAQAEPVGAQPLDTERLFNKGSGRFGKADPFSDVRGARIKTGPYRDRFVIGAADGFYLTPKGMSPAAVVEETTGNLSSSILEVLELGTEALSDRGFERVHWNPDTGEVTGIAPKGASTVRQQTAPEMPLELKNRPIIGSAIEGSIPALKPQQSYLQLELRGRP